MYCAWKRKKLLKYQPQLNVLMISCRAEIIYNDSKQNYTFYYSCISDGGNKYVFLRV